MAFSNRSPQLHKSTDSTPRLTLPSTKKPGTAVAPRVLLIDQSSDLRQFLRNCLSVELEAWAIDEARTGVQAVQSLNGRHAIVIVGMISSGESQLVAALRSMRKLQAIQIIKLRCWRAAPAWCDAALQHPFTEADLQRVVNGLLQV